MTNPVTHPHWRVSVETSGDLIVAIETEMLCGREISEADESAIRTAAHHLLAFIGDPSPQPNVVALKLSEKLADQVDHCLLGYAISRQNGLSIDDAMLHLRVACDEFRAALATTEAGRG